MGAHHMEAHHMGAHRMGAHHMGAHHMGASNVHKRPVCNMKHRSPFFKAVPKIVMREVLCMPANLARWVQNTSRIYARRVKKKRKHVLFEFSGRGFHCDGGCDAEASLLILNRCQSVLEGRISIGIRREDTRISGIENNVVSGSRRRLKIKSV